MHKDVAKASRESTNFLQENFIDLLVRTQLFRIRRIVPIFWCLDCVRLGSYWIREDLWVHLSLSQQHERFVDSYPRDPGGEFAIPAKTIQVHARAEHCLLNYVLSVLAVSDNPEYCLFELSAVSQEQFDKCMLVSSLCFIEQAVLGGL